MPRVAYSFPKSKTSFFAVHCLIGGIQCGLRHHNAGPRRYCNVQNSRDPLKPPPRYYTSQPPLHPLTPTTARRGNPSLPPTTKRSIIIRAFVITTTTATGSIVPPANAKCEKCRHIILKKKIRGPTRFEPRRGRRIIPKATIHRPEKYAKNKNPIVQSSTFQISPCRIGFVRNWRCIVS